MYFLYSQKLPCIALCLLSLVITSHSPAQDSGSDVLLVKYTDGQIFSVTGEDFKVRIDINGFQQTYDGPPSDEIIFTAGHGDRRMIAQVTFDTLYTDLERTAGEYHKLWWYFYSKDTTAQIGARREWTEGGRHWSTFTILSTYGFEVNEKHYDMFELTDTHSFHVSIKRPLYLEGDSTLMLSILESFEVVLPEDSAGSPDGAGGVGGAGGAGKTEKTGE